MPVFAMSDMNKTSQNEEDKIAIILTPDEQGMKRIFGIPAIRRIVLLCSQLGFRDVHIVGLTDPFRSVVADIVKPERFHAATGRESMDEISRLVIGGRPCSVNRKFLAMRAGLVIDKVNLTRLISREGPDICYMETDGAKERIFLAASRYIAPDSEACLATRQLF